MRGSLVDIEGCPFIVLCGGDNTRLEVLRGTIYKPFLQLRDTTLVAKHVTRATMAGHTRIRIVVDSRDPLVEAYVAGLAGELGIDVRLSVVPGGAREKVVEVLGPYPTLSLAVVVLGDTYSWYDPRRLLSRVESGDVDCCLAIARYRLPFGVVKVDGESIIGFSEKPETDFLVNVGAMALGPTAIDLLTRGVAIDRMLADLAAKGRLGGIEVSNGFLSVDSLDGIARALSAEGQDLLSQ